MARMVLQALLFSALALGFILTKSDGLRQAARTGDATHLLDSTRASASLASLTGQELGYSAGVQPWYTKLDPRRWGDDTATPAKLKPKTIVVPTTGPQDQADLALRMAAEGLDPGKVAGVVALD
nr:hypothetical protein [uncultured Celeribacter sp.]